MAGKYHKYSKYRNTDVQWLGNIPEHWDVEKFKYLFLVSDERNGNNIVGEMLSVSGYRGIEIKQYDDDAKKRTDDELVDYRVVRPGQLVVNTMWLNYAGLGVSEFKGHVSPAYRSYWISKKLYGRYCHHLLRSADYIAGYTKYMQGIRPNSLQIKTDDFNSFPILFPSYEEQKSVAAFLDYETAKIDRLIKKQQQLIALLKEKRQAVISHAVTKGLDPDVKMKDSDVEWLGEVPEHWKVKRLKNTTEVVDCRNKTPEYFEDGEYFVVRTTNVKKQKLNMNAAFYTDKVNFKIWTQRGVPPAGSILFTREAPAGEICLVPENIKFCMGQRMMNFICHDPEYTNYLFDFLLSDCLERYIVSVSHGSTVSHLRVEQVENIPVIVPPQNEANEIHKALEKIKTKYLKLTEEAEKGIALMQERRTALISAAVTGKIDVRNWQADKSSAA